MDADEQIGEIFDTVKAMHQLAITLQAAFSATQTGLIAMAEQLTDQELVDGTVAAERMRELKGGRFVTEEAMRAIDVLANEFEALSRRLDQPPPKGTKPRLVK